MSARSAIYLDANAGAPVHPAVIEALLPWLSQCNGLIGNPSSAHSLGRSARRLATTAREAVASSLGNVDPCALLQTSSGTEANHTAVRSAMHAAVRRGVAPHWVISSVEHDSHPALVPWVESIGGRVSVIPVDSEGRLRLDALESAVERDTALVSAIWVNNETGVIQDVLALRDLTRRKGVPLHLDAAQAWGKIEVNLPEMDVEYVSLCAHKIGAFAGTGMLWSRKGATVEPLFPGKQEGGKRGGTENLLGLVALGAAAAKIAPAQFRSRLAPLRDDLESFVLREIPGARVNGSAAERVANTSNLSFARCPGGSPALLQALDRDGFCLSAGSACASGTPSPSPVLLAMGRSPDEARSALRISLHGGNTREEILRFQESLLRVCRRMGMLGESHDSRVS